MRVWRWIPVVLFGALVLSARMVTTGAARQTTENRTDTKDGGDV